MAELTKREAEKAYNAGYALPTVDWSPALAMHDELGDGTGISDAKARTQLLTPGPHHCPFAEGDPQRDHWLRGLRARLTEPAKDPAAIVADIDKELDK